MFKFLTKILDQNQKELDKLRPIVEKVSFLEPQMVKFSDEKLAAKTAEFKERLAKGEALDNLVAEAFAVCREAIKRTVGERAFDVQLLAGLVLHQGKIAEQRTGEGKTLSSTLALYLNALSGQGCHLVTVNDYLARRDAGWYGKALQLLGLKVASIIHEQSFLLDPEFIDPTATDDRLAHLRPVTRQEAYLADVTYGTNNEFGFDYLRDNMVGEVSQMVQRGHHFAIVDEVDSILIDEARTPLIISAPDTEPTSKYYEFAKLAERLSSETDFIVDEKFKTANLTDHGIRKVEKMLGVDNLYEKDFETLHHIENALRAKALFSRDRDYVIKDNQIVIVDEFTGRLMFGRRWSEGLHQAVEAKEGVQIQQESRTLATISFQNYFRMYEKLAGMTGTAATEAEEFNKIYKLEVEVVPTNKPMIRIDQADVVYKTQRAKYAAVVREIEDCYRRGQPVLVGTTSIEKNEILDDFLTHKGIPHQVLNAKYHEKEALIIAQAGAKGAVTVATNMAGRGVDVILGGKPPEKLKIKNEELKVGDDELCLWEREHEEVVKKGGLHVIGTERHESRRIDNQLRGRSGRQGDPGSSRFFVALDDDLMRIFGGGQVSRLMTMFKMPEDVPLEHSMVSKAIEQAQVKVEGFNFDARKHLVEYDDVMNKQREIIYKLRKRVLIGERQNLKEEIKEKMKVEMEASVAVSRLAEIVPMETRAMEAIKSRLQNKSAAEIAEFLTKVAFDAYEQWENRFGPQLMRQIERFAYLSTIDHLWMDHLDAVDDLREGIGLRGYGQRDPLVEYKTEAFAMFEQLMERIDAEIVRRVFRIQVTATPTMPQNIQTNIDTADMTGVRPVKATEKIGRNDPCWCGSGRKYKRCHYPQPPPR
jgi:preprotein translocase subunit SecA